MQQRKYGFTTWPRKHYRDYSSQAGKGNGSDPGLNGTAYLTVVAALSVRAHGISHQGAGRGVATRVHALLQEKNTPQQVEAGKADLLSAGCPEREPFLCGRGRDAAWFIQTVEVWRCGAYVLDLRLVKRGVFDTMIHVKPSGTGEEGK